MTYKYFLSAIIGTGILTLATFSANSAAPPAPEATEPAVKPSEGSTRELYAAVQAWYVKLQQKRPGPDASPEEIHTFNKEYARYQTLLEQYQFAAATTSRNNKRVSAGTDSAAAQTPRPKEPYKGSKKTTEQPGNTEQQDTRLNRGKDLVIREFGSHFSKSGDGLFTALFPDNPPAYFQLKSPTIKSDVPELNDADRLNKITWSAYYTITFAAYRVSVTQNEKTAWRDWADGRDDGSCDGNQIWFNFIEQDGELKLKTVSMRVGDILDNTLPSFDFDRANKVDALPESLR